MKEYHKIKAGDNIGNSGNIHLASADYAKGYRTAFKFMAKNGILYSDDDITLSKVRNRFPTPEGDSYTIFIVTIQANHEVHEFVLTDKQKEKSQRVVAN